MGWRRSAERRAASTTLRPLICTPRVDGWIFFHTASIVDGGFGAMLYVTETAPLTSVVIRLASLSRISQGRCVGVPIVASMLSQHRISI